ncbi:unnamed protein product [Allacma fusca]|uniref:Uncharacterized protein n=1 Tax=Allacma fusca TaxID=39272 RepID=A0A8J2PZQ3_9HEXA|nr:unnamed protein product [Allacma fusca]
MDNLMGHERMTSFGRGKPVVMNLPQSRAKAQLWFCSGYMFDREQAKKVDGNIQEALFIMAVANSCVNPVVYGTYTKECRDTVIHCCADNSRRRTLRGNGLHSKSTIFACNGHPS